MSAGGSGPSSRPVLIAALSALLRPVLVALATRLGWVGALLLAVFGQAFIIWLVFWDPGVGGVSILSAIVAAWIVAFVSTGAVWVVTAGTDEAVTAGLIRKASRGKGAVLPDAEVPGVVFVQADGVPFPVLELGVKGGTLPTLSRWVRSGSHQMAEWRPTAARDHPGQPDGHPARHNDGIPAFRWVDRATGRVFVANKPADAADIEALHSDGHGLLADDGVSVSNLFTGDAPTAYVTMSAIKRTQETKEARASVSRFLARPTAWPAGSPGRSARSSASASRPGGPFAGTSARACTAAGASPASGPRSTACCATSTPRWWPSPCCAAAGAIYVDYVDYDAMAHHAGILRQESLDALAGIDAVLAQLEKVAEVAPRPYRFVVLSDHGQSQGEVFADRYGEDLATLVGRLADAHVTAAIDADSEGAGRVNAFAASAGSSATVLGRALDRATDQLSPGEFADGGLSEGPAPTPADAPAPGGPAGADEFLVFGSGNLGLVYVAGEDHRLTQRGAGRAVPRPGTRAGRAPGGGVRGGRVGRRRAGRPRLRGRAPAPGRRGDGLGPVGPVRP